ncbi:MAG: septum formation initiator family protein [Ignavibacteria bacterium]|nr:septum formation initiator family protein [Ignavibacteria bacterium]
MSDEEKQTRSNARKRKYTFWLVLLLVLLLVVFSDSGLYKRFQLELEKTEMIEKIENEMKRKDSLNTRIKRLLYDTTEIERIAREKYGMTKPNEEVIIIEREKK